MNNTHIPAMAFHPGEYLIDELNERQLTQTALAKIMWKPIKTINEIIKWKKSITAEMAVLLEWVFWTSASSWLWLQNTYDLHKARIANDSKYKAIIKNYKNYQKKKLLFQKPLFKKTSQHNKQ